MSGATIERTGFRGALALCCVDAGTGAAVADDLIAVAWLADQATGQPPLPSPATRSPLSALLGFGRLPGLGRLQRARTTGGEPLQWPTGPPPVPFAARVVDVAGRYLPVVLVVDCPAPAPVDVPLFGAPTRRTPSGWATVRGEVHTHGGAPAAWALVEVDTGMDACQALTDAQGRFVAVLPYPEALPALSETPAAGAGIDQLTWPLEVGVRHDSAALSRAPGSRDDDPPALSSIQAQTPAQVLTPGGLRRREAPTSPTASPSCCRSCSRHDRPLVLPPRGSRFAMPQYLAPGVYVEEIAGPRTIEGVSTSTAAFVGPCRTGPTSGTPSLLTNYADFSRIYGDAVDLEFEDAGQVPNYLAMGVKGFFDEGGSSLYVARTFAYRGPGAPEADHAVGVIGPVTVRARFPGASGNMRVTLTLRSGGNALVITGGTPQLTRVHEYDLVWALSNDSPPAGAVHVVRRDPVSGDWTLAGRTSLALGNALAVYPLTVVVEVRRPTVDALGLPGFGPSQVVGEFGFDPRALGTAISTVLTARPPTRRQALTAPIAFVDIDAMTSPPPSLDELPGDIAMALFGPTILATASVPTTLVANRQISVALAGGSDGNAPQVNAYVGDATGFSDYQNNAVDLPQNGLLALESIEDISIVAAPGASTGWGGKSGDPQASRQSAQAINNAVTTHCERLVYRVACLDTPPQMLPDDALDFRNQRSSTHAALYHPWLTVTHPVDGSRIDVPPAAYMAGIWARSDNQFGPIKAPANEVVRSALDFEVRLNKPQQELLNPQGVNCLRFFPGSGFLVWGARTISDDPQWKYLSLRRYFNYVERSIDEGTQWVVFEVNGPALWDSVKHTVQGFLRNEWRNGALLGRKPEQGFYVRCDESTMSAEDMDLGRLIVEIGIWAAKPAEFVIFRVSQMTVISPS